MVTQLVEHLQKRIRDEGPLSFHDYMEEVLYHPQLGYYSAERNPIGNQGDFLTSADLDPIFGQILSTQFEQMAQGLPSFTVVELGAGKGLLARDILRRQSFPYVILERSQAMRRRQQEMLEGFDVRWVDRLPQSLTGCIFSNEFFDALPVHRVVRRGDSLKEFYVTENFGEIEGELQFPAVVPIHMIREGQTVEVNVEARLWMRRIAQSLEQGYHIAIDYGHLRDEFYRQPHGTLMCYRRHEATEDPYTYIGEQDMTAHVNFSDLIEEGEASGLMFRSLGKQMDFLIERGILDEIQKLAVAGDGESMRRLLRIKKMILPANMGERFKVLIQEKRSSRA